MSYHTTAYKTSSACYYYHDMVIAMCGKCRDVAVLGLYGVLMLVERSRNEACVSSTEIYFSFPPLSTKK